MDYLLGAKLDEISMKLDTLIQILSEVDEEGQEPKEGVGKV